MESYAVFAGHSQLKSGSFTGASGYINEAVENELVAKAVDKWLKIGGANSDLFIIPRKYLSSKDLEDDYKIPKANAKNYTGVVEIHFNANKTVDNPMGTECIYSEGSTRGRALAQRVNDRLDDVFKDRNVKSNAQFYMLRRVTAPSIIIEVCFVDSKSDVNLYRNNGYDKIGKLIAEGMLNKTIADTSSPKKYEHCVLYGNDIDDNGAEIIGWELKDCIVKHIDNHIAWEGNNLYIVGGTASENKFKALNTGEKYTMIGGKDRVETVIECLKFVGRL